MRFGFDKYLSKTLPYEILYFINTGGDSNGKEVCLPFQGR